MINLDTKIEIKFIHLSFEPGTESRHSHDENQLLFFISGKGIEFIENRKFKITPGTFILIPEKKVHFFKSYSNKPSEILSIRFKLSHEVKNKITTDFFKKPYLYRSGKEDIEKIKKLIPSMINGKPDLKFFFKIFNMFFETAEKKNEKLTEYIEKIENYIEKNIKEPIKIDKICKSLGLSKSYIRKIIKKNYGVSFTKFVNIKKIDYATKILIEKKLPIYEVAGICGFYDFNYFSRIFKKIKGMSPREFRKNYL